MFATLKVISNQDALKFVVPLYIFLMLLVTVVFTLPQRTLSYRLEHQVLQLKYWFGCCEINLQNAKLEIVQVKSVWRLSGISTGFYNAGLFRANNEEVQVYGSSLKGDVVMIRQAGKNTIITPADPQGFLKLVQDSRVL